MVKSIVCGNKAPPLLEYTIGEALDRAAALWPDGEALVDRGQGIRLTWAQLRQRAEDLAAGLLRLGLVSGDRVGIWSPNRHEWALTQFATAKAGLILVNINPAYRLAELEFALAKVGCAALVTATSFKSSDYAGMLRALIPEMAHATGSEWRSARFPELRRVIQLGTDPIPGAIAFAELERMGREAGWDGFHATHAGHPADPINIQFTSGTTGSPKGVMLTHHNILNNGYFVGEALHLTPRDRICIPVPLYHCFGMVAGNLAAVTHGATMVYPGEGFSPRETLEAVAAEKCTALYGVPTMFIAELDDPSFAEHDLSSLRTGIMGGAPCPVEVMNAVVERMHLRQITIAYGMTETSPVSFQTGLDAPVHLRVATVGTIHPHLEVKIVDVDGQIVERGETGELCTRGYSVMAGYWDEPDQTARALDAEGWMRTGDLATIDEDGYCRIVGRIKDMVIRGGENIYPREIEEFLYRHPAIRDVAVFGVPDARYGEDLCAWIIAHDGVALDVDSVRAFCRDQISHQKVPRHIRIVESFPMTMSGKVQKFRMRAAMAEEFGLPAKPPPT